VAEYLAVTPLETDNESWMGAGTRQHTIEQEAALKTVAITERN
jgi:hypothetical protein